MEEEFKKINGYEDYMIGNCGSVISLKNGEKRYMKPYLDSQKRYYIIVLSKNGKTKKFLVHRLVAIHFCENPNNKDVVNHIDHNTRNNNYKNLEWVTTQENVIHSYATMGPVRNKRKCKLIYPNGDEFFFDSFPDLQKHKIANNLIFSDTSLRYNGHSQGYYFEKL